MNIIFTIGGDRRIQTIYDEITKREMKVVIVGIPKKINNDIGVIGRSFGLESSLEQAVKNITSANIEVNSVWNRISQVIWNRLWVYCIRASLASRNVNMCIIPESPFYLYGNKGLLEFEN